MGEINEKTKEKNEMEKYYFISNIPSMLNNTYYFNSKYSYMEIRF